MTRIGLDPPILQPYAPTAVVEPAHGWYFYGITEGGSLTPALLASCGESQQAASVAAFGNASALQLVELSSLAAVVRRVLLDDFRPEALRDRLHNDNGLELLARYHNDVIEAIHARQAILPSKLGVVFAHQDDIMSALQASHDALVRKLHRLRSCDEWAIHLYADQARIRERVANAEPVLEKLRSELAVARPGRAYFLEQRLRDQLHATAEQVLVKHAEKAFDRLATFAVDALASPAQPATDMNDDVEILRASFLIPRDNAEQFQAEVRLSCDETDGLRCECTGPWPPYSFAAQDEGEMV
jgi:hypothetical protein